MRISIFTEGGTGRGLGHIARCEAIAQAFEEKGIKSNSFIAADETIKEFLANRPFELINWFDDSQVKKVSDALNMTDVTIVDSYVANAACLEKMAAQSKHIYYLDDNNRLSYPQGTVINGAIYAQKLDYVKRSDLKYLLGLNWTTLRKPFWDVPDKAINNEVNTILLTCGGVDSKNATEKILKILIQRYSNLKKTVVIGAGFALKNQLMSYKLAQVDFIDSPGAEAMKALMLENDLAVTSCGQTLHELARIGIPTVGVCVSENQKLNAQYWAEAGFLEYAGPLNDEALERKLGEKIDLLQSPKERLKRHHVGRRLVDGQGARHIVDKILNSMNVEHSSK